MPSISRNVDQQNPENAGKNRNYCNTPGENLAIFSKMGLNTNPIILQFHLNGHQHSKR